MDSLPISAIWSTIPGVVVLAPVFAFLLAVATVIIIGLLEEVVIPATVPLAACGYQQLAFWFAKLGRARSWSVVTAVEHVSRGVTRPVVGNLTPFPGRGSRHRSGHSWHKGIEYIRYGGLACSVGLGQANRKTSSVTVPP